MVTFTDAENVFRTTVGGDRHRRTWSRVQLTSQASPQFLIFETFTRCVPVDLPLATGDGLRLTVDCTVQADLIKVL